MLRIDIVVQFIIV